MKQMKQIVARCTCDGTAKQKNSVIMCNLLTKTFRDDVILTTIRRKDLAHELCQMLA